MLEEFGYNNTKSKTGSLYRKNNLAAFIAVNNCMISDSWECPKITLLLMELPNDKYFSLINDFVIDFADKISNLKVPVEPLMNANNYKERVIYSVDNYVFKTDISKRCRVNSMIDFERLEYKIIIDM